MLSLLTLPLRAAEPIAVAVLEFNSKGGIHQDKVDALSDLVAQRIQQAGDFRVIGKSDILGLLTMEEQRLRLGSCDDSSCLAELGGALGVPFMVAGNVSAFGERYLLNLKLIDVSQVVVASRVTRTVSGDENLLAAIPGAVDELLQAVVAFRQALGDKEADGDRFELTLNACLGGSEVHGYQNDVIDENVPVPYYADIGLHRWGIGGRFGVRFATHHTAFVQLDWLWEELSGRFSDQRDAGPPLSTNINLLRILAGYRFAWPVLNWLAPFVELGLGGSIYFPVKAQVAGLTDTTLELAPQARFAVMLGAGLRFSFLERGFVNLSWLYEVPLLGFSSGSFLVGGGVTF
jgi:TolB-like protein